jgi:hypothetical protein
MTNSELAQAVAELDEETAAALAQALTEDPELIESTLRDYGFLEDRLTPNHGTMESLTDSERRLYQIVQEANAPKSIPKLIEWIERHHESYTEAYGSYSDRSWLNRKLNALVEAGLIGKFRDGRTVVYTPEIREAVRHWALHNEQFVKDLSSRDVDEIVADTGMAKSEVAQAVAELSS